MRATDVFSMMLRAIRLGCYTRRVTDPTSPASTPMAEAEPGESFPFDPRRHLVRCKSIDLRWAVANTLHFFANTKYAAPLRKYNKYADRFLVGDHLPGAYGVIAMPQIHECIHLLSTHKESRRAVVQMGGLEFQDINRPSCLTSLQFLVRGQRLYMVVFQRSLHLHRVMPYDAHLLAHVLFYVAERLGLFIGDIRWTVGSLHTDMELTDAPEDTKRQESLFLPIQVLDSEDWCRSLLNDPTVVAPEGHWRACLQSPNEVRT